MNSLFYKSLNLANNSNNSNNSKIKNFKLFNLPGFNYIKTPINIKEKLEMNNNISYDDQVINEKIFTKFIVNVDNSNNKKFKKTKKNKFNNIRKTRRK